MKDYELIIFDVDGTLLDTSKGIFNSVRYAEKAIGFTPISDNRLKEFVWPPPKKMYMSVYGVSDEIAMAAAKKHREYGRNKAIYEAIPYPNMQLVLSELRKRGYKLAVATLKSQGIAESVLKFTGLYDYFDAIIGMDDGESITKADTIRLAIGKSGVKNVKAAVMVGDSEYDLVGAAEVGIDFVAVLYGFGFNENSNITYTNVKNPTELLEIFL